MAGLVEDLVLSWETPPGPLHTVQLTAGYSETVQLTTGYSETLQLTAGYTTVLDLDDEESEE